MKANKIGGFRSIFYVLKKARKSGVLRLGKSMLRKNTCKTCALGMGGQKGGMVNELGRFPEMCKKSVQAMASDLQPPIPVDFFEKHSLEGLSYFSSKQLEESGRIAYPVYKGPGDSHYQRIEWEEAFRRVSDRLKNTAPQRSFFYFSGRSSNEAGFLLQLLARVYGTNHVNNCSYYCHQASGVGLGKALGSGTATVTLEDLESSDLVVLLGANPSSNHPRFLESIRHMKKRGGKLMVINPMKEPGLVRFHIPSDLGSLIFGSQMADEYVQPNIGGDLALLSGVAKAVLESGDEAEGWIGEHSTGFPEFKEHILGLSWSELESESGIKKAEIVRIKEILCSKKKIIFSWAMGLTHHLHGVDNVSAVINLAMLLGQLGKEGCGLLPLRGHSNVQGMGTVGVTPKLKTEIFERLSQMGVKLPDHEGFDTMACMEASFEGKMDFAFCLGGNLYESNPELSFAQKALSEIGMTVYLSTTLNKGHILGAGKESLIFPVKARDEESQATTQESMFNFVRLSSGGPTRLRGVLSEVEIISKIGEMSLGAEPVPWKSMGNHKTIRDWISKAIPGLEPICEIEKKEEFTIPGRIPKKDGFASGKGKFVIPLSRPGSLGAPEELQLMTVRSEGQFNSVVYEEEDVFRGIPKRDVILLAKKDMDDLGLKEGQRVFVESKTGKVGPVEALSFDIKPGNSMMYYPEANPLISRELDPQAKTPGFKKTAIKIYSVENS